MSSGPVGRAVRIADQIKAELMDMVLRGAVKDPGVRDAVVTDVKVTEDLRHARVFVRVLQEDVSAQRRKQLVDAFGRASGFLRRELGRRLALRHTPELRFAWDEVIDQALRVEEVLQELERDGRDAGKERE